MHIKYLPTTSDTFEFEEQITDMILARASHNLIMDKITAHPDHIFRLAPETIGQFASAEPAESAE